MVYMEFVSGSENEEETSKLKRQSQLFSCIDADSFLQRSCHRCYYRYHHSFQYRRRKIGFPVLSKADYTNTGQTECSVYCSACHKIAKKEGKQSIEQLKKVNSNLEPKFKLHKKKSGSTIELCDYQGFSNLAMESFQVEVGAVRADRYQVECEWMVKKVAECAGSDIQILQQSPQLYARRPVYPQTETNMNIVKFADSGLNEPSIENWKLNCLLLPMKKKTNYRQRTSTIWNTQGVISPDEKNVFCNSTPNDHEPVFGDTDTVSEYGKADNSMFPESSLNKVLIPFRMSRFLTPVRYHYDVDSCQHHSIKFQPVTCHPDALSCAASGALMSSLAEVIALVVYVCDVSESDSLTIHGVTMLFAWYIQDERRPDGAPYSSDLQILKLRVIQFRTLTRMKSKAMSSANIASSCGGGDRCKYGYGRLVIDADSIGDSGSSGCSATNIEDHIKMGQALMSFLALAVAIMVYVLAVMTVVTVTAVMSRSMELPGESLNKANIPDLLIRYKKY
ncbi:hypothetical protein HW555_010669 [Spodoptera exigua]|uniref:Uncharacterized protein n=1 Tax=Spodoptera exigua TaxID=7107 RepID=A0A835G9Z8_SPOEX|nr:hypothetical protein HW555_010669 [Spodoptera exigua]